VSGVCDPLPSGQAAAFVALGVLVGSRVLDKERPAQTLLGVRCHSDLSHPPWPDGGSGVALASAFHEVWVADVADYARSPLSRENAAV
jgi:hypothetical protein